jgi:BlaI family transcriptional regulator, penicillinase repressor
MDDLEKLSKSEEDLMLIVWRLGEATVGNFLEEITEPKPPYTTLASMIKNLEKKNYLTSKRYGNVYVYQPAITEENYKKNFLGGVVHDYFKNSYKEMVSFFVKDEKISAQELKEIIALIEKKK